MHECAIACLGLLQQASLILWWLCIVQVIAPRQFGKSSIAQRLRDIVEDVEVPKERSRSGHASLTVLAICLSQQTPLVRYHQPPTIFSINWLLSMMP